MCLKPKKAIQTSINSKNDSSLKKTQYKKRGITVQTKNKKKRRIEIRRYIYNISEQQNIPKRKKTKQIISKHKKKQKGGRKLAIFRLF